MTPEEADFLIRTHMAQNKKTKVDPQAFLAAWDLLQTQPAQAEFEGTFVEGVLELLAAISE